MKKIFSYMLTGAGLSILFWCSTVYIQSREALNWPQAKGHVISSLLTINYLPRWLDWNTDPLRWYGTEVKYEYSVGDSTYTSNRLSFQKGDSGIAKETLNEMNKYRRHPKAMVYYNPKDPREAVLEPEDISDIYTPLMIAILLLCAGAVIISNQPVEFSRSIDSYIYQGQMLQKDGKLEEALWEYNQAISINPNLAIGYSNRGNLYLQHKSWDHAIADFNYVLSLDPRNAFAYFNLGNAYFGKKLFDQALLNMEKAVQLGFNVSPEIMEKIKNNL